jgi:hypothetical protein
LRDTVKPLKSICLGSDGYITMIAGELPGFYLLGHTHGHVQSLKQTDMALLLCEKEAQMLG